MNVHFTVPVSLQIIGVDLYVSHITNPTDHKTSDESKRAFMMEAVQALTLYLKAFKQPPIMGQMMKMRTGTSRVSMVHITETGISVFLDSGYDEDYFNDIIK